MTAFLPDPRRALALCGATALLLLVAVAAASGAPRGHNGHRPAKASDAKCRSHQRHGRCRAPQATKSQAGTPADGASASSPGTSSPAAVAPAAVAATANAAAPLPVAVPPTESPAPVPTPTPTPTPTPSPVEEEEGPSPPSAAEEPAPAEEPATVGKGPEGGSPEPGGAKEEPASREAPAPAAGPKLQWAPPELVNPITIHLGTGFTHTSLSPFRDYILDLPPTDKLGGTWIDGGHNVVIIGGEITVPTGTEPGTANDAQRNGIYIKGSTGTVHVEGVTINAQPGVEFDGVDINAPEATVDLENMRIEGVRGTFSGFHGDVVQPWGGVRDLRIDRMSGTSNYQGLTLQQDLGPIGSAQLSEVDLTGTTEGTLDKGGHLLWLTKGSNTCIAFPVQMSDVFVSPRPGLSLGTSIWPASNSKLTCDESGLTPALWPALPISGGVMEGPPPGGSYVPPGVAGLSYASPGYLE